MNSQISPIGNGSHKLSPEKNPLPDGFFEEIPRDSHPRKIFDDNPPHRNKTPPKNGHSQEAQITQENLKAIISSQLKSYLDAIKLEIITDFKTVLHQRQEENKLDTKYIL